MLAASAYKMVAQPDTITGNIGVAFGRFNALQLDTLHQKLCGHDASAIKISCNL